MRGKKQGRCGRWALLWSTTNGKDTSRIPHPCLGGKDCMLIGYMRVSTKDQRFDLQHDALLAAGVQERYLYSDVASGAKAARPGLGQCLKALHPGDTLVAWKLDRLARSSLHLLELVQDLASITASATFGHSASPDNVPCWYIMALPCALKIYVKYFDNFCHQNPLHFNRLQTYFLFQ